MFSRLKDNVCFEIFLTIYEDKDSDIPKRQSILHILLIIFTTFLAIMFISIYN